MGVKMQHEWTNKLVVGITSTALFDLREAQEVFDKNKDNKEIYYRYTLKHENEILQPGTGFHFVKALLAINKDRQEPDRLVEVVLISRNDADTGFRVFQSIKHHQLDIRCGAFTGGGDQYPFLESFACDLFLSTNLVEVRSAHTLGIPAALLYGLPGKIDPGTDEVRIAFDGDCVLFSEETQKVFDDKKLPGALDHERKYENKLLEPGPFKPFLDAVSRIQKMFRPDNCPIRTSLVTARGLEMSKRPTMTLREWGIHLDRTFYLAGMKKWHVLSVLKPHIFFDDSKDNLEDILGGLVLRELAEAPEAGKIPKT